MRTKPASRLRRIVDLASSKQTNAVSEVFKVFYCWQSDTNSNHTRYLIREALEAAAESVGGDDSNPFRIVIESDTENASGLCDIPETILTRLREADAVVSDLTFIAKSANPDQPKHCSNPNVLFELGYALHAIGHERIICVMNEEYGSSRNQIFDLAHRRFPISYRSPTEGKARREVVETLAKQLAAALKAIVALGKAGLNSNDDSIQHERQLSQVDRFHQTTTEHRSGRPQIRFTFRPERFREHRWSSADQLEKAVREHGVVTGRGHLFPPQPTGTSAMDWGIYNDTYGDPWALTYAGQFWTTIPIGGHGELELSNFNTRGLRSVLGTDAPTSLKNDEWIGAFDLFPGIARCFALGSNLARLLGPKDRIEWTFEASDLDGRWLIFGQHEDKVGPARAPTINRSASLAAEDFMEQSSELAVAIGKTVADCFSADGRLFERQTIAEWTNPLRP